MPDNDILKRCTKAFEDIEELLDLANRQKAEIERLQKQLKEGIDLSDDVFKFVKSKSYREFAERVKEKSHISLNKCGEMKPLICFEDIDTTLKELTEK